MTIHLLFFVASQLMVVAAENPVENRFALPGGQSGNFLFPYYDDQLPFCLEGEGLTVAWTPAQVQKVAESTLDLLPSV